MRGIRTLGTLLASVCTAAIAAGPVAPAQDSAQETAPAAAAGELVPEFLPYSVTINGGDAGDAALLRLPDGTLLARDTDWDRWHLRRPAGMQYLFEGETYYALDQAPGFAAQLDTARQQARLEFAPRAFERTLLSAAQDRRVTPQPPPGPGGFLNYEFVGTRRAPEGFDASSNVNGLLEAGAFNAAGVATSQWLGLNLTGEETPAFGAAERRVIRLETALTRDFPDAMETLRLGDGIGSSGLWGRPVRYGGVRWARNFATQPGFVTLPQPALGGETALPSVLDIYIDGVRRQSLESPPGEFLVENVPVLSGQGEVQLVVRDLLGRERIISDSYFTAARMLRPGLHDFSYEAGLPRERFGRASDDYGDFFASTTHRYGVLDRLTGEARLELSGDVQTAGVGAVFAVPPLGVFSNAFAVSHSDTGFGALDTLTFQRIVRRGLTLGARWQGASSNFAQLGLAPGVSPPRQTLGANLGYSGPPLGSFGIAYASQDNFAPLADVEAVTATYSVGLRRAALTLLGIRQLEPREDTTVGLNLSVPFGYGDYAAAGYRRRDATAGADTAQSYARLQRNLPQDLGWGYRAIVSQAHADGGDATEGAELGLAANGAYGSYAVEAALSDQLETYRGTVSGGFGALGGHAFASRKILGSFAVIEAGAADVEVLVNNRLAGRTNADGVAVLPYLQPYQYNTIKVDGTTVPIDVEVRTDEVKAAPYFRSGMLVPLDVRRARAALLTLVLADGKPVPAGAVATLAGGGEFPVARQGTVFLTGLTAQDNTLDVRWKDHRCIARFEVPAEGGAQPELGPVPCARAMP